MVRLWERRGKNIAFAVLELRANVNASVGVVRHVHLSVVVVVLLRQKRSKMCLHVHGVRKKLEHRLPGPGLGEKEKVSLGRSIRAGQLQQLTQSR